VTSSCCYYAMLMTHQWRERPVVAHNMLSITHMENDGKNLVTGQETGKVVEVTGWCIKSRCCDHRASYWVHGFLSESIKEHLLSRPSVKFRMSWNILGLWRRKVLLTLSWVRVPSGATGMEAGRDEVPRAPACLIGCSVGTWSSSWAGTLEPMTDLERASLICARGTDEACVWVPSWESLGLRRYLLDRRNKWNTDDELK
jgi:hypothetical protein